MNNKVQILAFYLPQFHRFKENDEWWGEGFTEWVNVKKAVPLFKGHEQPRVPLNDNYYDLSNPKDIQWQVDLAKEYGLGGFCIYHYWFDGKLLLDKPIDLFKRLERKIDYCFCWANEPWTRSWDGETNVVLMPQRYGGEKEWEDHFQYLLPFFKDSYYIKKNNKPMLVLYRTNNIPNCDDMIRYWDRRCVEEGFDGIYTVEEMNAFQKKAVCKYTDAVLEFEPMNALKKRNFWIMGRDYIRSRIHDIKNKTHLSVFQYDDVWKSILARNYKTEDSDKKIYLGGFVGWDNTARKGTNGLVLDGATPEKFKQNLQKQVERARLQESEYIFINAWNEWGEGTYLEPDEKHGTKYLEAIKAISEEE